MVLLYPVEAKKKSCTSKFSRITTIACKSLTSILIHDSYSLKEIRKCETSNINMNYCLDHYEPVLELASW